MVDLEIIVLNFHYDALFSQWLNNLIVFTEFTMILKMIKNKLRTRSFFSSYLSLKSLSVINIDSNYTVISEVEWLVKYLIILTLCNDSFFPSISIYRSLVVVDKY